MAIFSNTTAPTNRDGSLMYAWAKPISNFLTTAGWAQQADTGQIVWPASVVNIVSVANSGGTAEIYTYTLTQGAVLQVNSTVVINGCTNAGFNGTFIITALGAGTFTCTNATGASESCVANTAWGAVDVRVTISNAVGNGTSNTYTYAVFDGLILAGQSIVVTGCTTTGFNNTFTIASVNTGAGTFTTTSTNAITHASEAETGVGLVTVLKYCINTASSTTTTFPPAANTYFYEIWKMGDGNGFPLFMKLAYGTAGASIDPNLQITLCASTDGAGNPTGGSTGVQQVGQQTGGTGNSLTTFASYMSGSSNRLQLAMWPASGAVGGIITIERSHDSSGVDTTAYATIAAVVASNTPFSLQTSVTATTTSVTAETKLAAMLPRGAVTGNFGASTLVSPVFPLVGAIGNPLLGLVIGKKADWTDSTQFGFTLYNVSHNYIMFNQTWLSGVAVITADSAGTNVAAMRYE